MKNIVLAIAPILINGCAFYDYGVRQDNPQVIQDSFIPQKTTRGKYEFASKLNSEPSVVVFHPKSDYHRHSAWLAVSSSNEFSIISVKFELSDSEERIIEPIETDWADTSESKKYFLFKSYYPKNLPRKGLSEIIEIRYRNAEGEKELKYRLPLKYKLHYTTYDIMMSV